MTDQRVGLLGATSLVGECLLPLLLKNGWQVVAFSRKPVMWGEQGVEWRQIDHASSASAPLSRGEERLLCWICVAPIWALAEHLSLLESHGVRRIVVLSSTSRFTKTDSSDAAEGAVAGRLAKGEERLKAWASSKGVEWVILRPTLIYGLGRDKNIGEIARFVRRFGFFPLFGRARGLRQPIHVNDVAGACLAALNSPVAASRAYNLSGGEALSYREMVCRVFAALGKRPRLVRVPLWIFRVGVAALHLLPRYRHWTAEMAARMNRDLVFDHADAARDLGFSPRPFQLSREDLPA